MSNPDWDGNKAGRQAMAARILSYIYPPEFFGSDSNHPISEA
jgi:hypothetical protein